MKQTWIWINELINRGKKEMKSINALKGPNSSQLIHDPSKLPTILNQYFAHSDRHYSEYLGPLRNHINSFLFNPVTPDEIESEVSLLPMGKSVAWGTFLSDKDLKNIRVSLVHHPVWKS